MFNFFSIFKRVFYLFYRIQDIENRLSEVEDFIDRDNYFKDKEFNINSDNKNQLKGIWKRIDNFKNYKRIRTMCSHQGILYCGCDDTPDKGAIQKYVKGKWINISIPEVVDEVVNIAAHAGNIFVCTSSKINGASVWIVNKDKLVKKGNWKNYYAAMGICSFKDKLYVSLVPYSKNEVGGPILSYDGAEWTVILDDHPYFYFYSLTQHNDSLYATSISYGFFGGHLLSIDISNNSYNISVGYNIKNNKNKISHLLRTFSHSTGLYVVGNLVLPNTRNLYSIFKFNNNELQRAPIIKNNYRNFYSYNAILFYKNKLIIGTGGRPAGNARVLVLDENDWYLIGGDGVFNSWSSKIYKKLNYKMQAKSAAEYVYSLCEHNGKIIAGFGASKGNGQVWEFESKD
tara:strand:+ start:2107 stop:3306 length:1200 start_codon:yes stop_codon:yes gene_type:complete